MPRQHQHSRTNTTQQPCSRRRGCCVHVELNIPFASHVVMEYNLMLTATTDTFITQHPLGRVRFRPSRQQCLV